MNCITLEDGTDITIEELDRDRSRVVEDVFAAMSQESRYFRYLQAVPRLTPGLRAALTAVDGDRHMALAAFAGGEAVGIARLVRDQGGVELALEVADHFAGRGLGRALADAALEHASRAGIEEVALLVHPENHRAVRLFRSLGARFQYETGLLVGTLAVGARMAVAA